jgi:hypothetical protein
MPVLIWVGGHLPCLRKSVSSQLGTPNAIPELNRVRRTICLLNYFALRAHSRTAARLDVLGRAARCLGKLRNLIDNPLNPAAVEIEFTSNGALAVAASVPGLYRLLQAWRFGQRGCGVVFCDRQRLVYARRRSGLDTGSAVSSDECQKEFEGTSQSQGGPGADQRSVRGVATMRRSRSQSERVSQRGFADPSGFSAGAT